MALSQENTLAEQELISSLSWLIALRWPAGLGVLGATWFATGVLTLNIPATRLYLLGTGLLLYNLLLWWGLGRLNAVVFCPNVVYQWFARFQIGLDWAAMTLLIHFSGGIESPALFYFLFHIPIASLLLPHDRGFLYVTLGPLLVGGVACLEYWQVLPHTYVFEPARYNNIFYITGILFFFTSAAYVMTYLSMTISQRLRRREDELTGLYQSVQATTSTLDLTEVLNRLAEATTKALRCKGADIRLLDATGCYLELVGTYGMSEVCQDQAPIALTQALIDQAALADQTVLIPDTAREPRLRDPDQVLAEGIQAILCTPLINKRGAIGVLRAYSDSTYHFTEHDAAFLRAIAAEGVVAIEHAQAYELLEDLDQNKSQFIRIITHELRSPVQVTVSLLNVLDQGYVGSLNEKQTDLVTRARRRLQFLQSLIDDLLDLAAGKTDVPPSGEQTLISLNDLLKAVQTRFETPAQDKNLTLRFVPPDESVQIWGHQGELDRLLNNLVSNAIKYTQVGEVCLHLEQRDDFAYLTVTDTGIGIPKEAIPHLFDEFFRAENAKALPETIGTGLGLAITKDLVERYKGKIGVESAEGQGTTFTIILPLAKTPSV